MKKIILLSFISVCVASANLFGQSFEQKAQEVLDASQEIKDRLEDAENASNILTKQINVLGQTGTSVADPFEHTISTALNEINDKQDEIEVLAGEMAAIANISEVTSILYLPSQMENKVNGAVLDVTNIYQAVSVSDLQAANTSIALLNNKLQQIEFLNNQIITFATFLTTPVKTIAGKISLAGNYMKLEVDNMIAKANQLNAMMNVGPVSFSDVYSALYAIQQSQNTIEGYADDMITNANLISSFDATVDVSDILNKANAVKSQKILIQDYIINVFNDVSTNNYPSARANMYYMNISLSYQKGYASQIVNTANQIIIAQGQGN